MNLVSAEGFEPSCFVSPQVQIGIIGTYQQQVAARVMGYLWYLAYAWHTTYKRQTTSKCTKLR